MPPKPTSSKVLEQFLIQRKCPYWTSYFVKYSDMNNDHHGLAHFNFQLQTHQGNSQNYEILRTGCYPYVKYHCTLTNPPNNLTWSNRVIRLSKIVTGCVPCLVYGTAALFLITHHEKVESLGDIKIYFLIAEDHSARN